MSKSNCPPRITRGKPECFLNSQIRSLPKGDVLQASEKLWGATSHAIKAVAEHRGWDHGKNSHRRLVVRRLAEEYEEFWLRAGYAAAEQFHANFYNNFMEDDAIEDYRPIVHELVKRLLNGSREGGQQA